MLNSFVSELKRRNVFRVAVAYTVFSWLVAQVAATLEEGLGLPEWFDTLILAVLIIGFPIAVIISWAYEVTPEGLKKTDEVDVSDSVTAHTGKRLDILTIAAVVVLIVFMLGKSHLEVSEGPAAPEETASTAPEPESKSVQSDNASIAVLPFVNLSADPEQEYFSDGISEELLNLFAKIPELRVAARTSSFQFKGRNMDVPLIGEQLNVAHVLEGSVRKANNKIRITAQLIQTETGFHLWSETYDRELDDIFAIQDEISAAIVAELGKILGVESQLETPESNHSANTEAYNEYLLGEFFDNKNTPEGTKKALTHYKRAVELDPEYALAYVGIAGNELFLSDAIGTDGVIPLADQIPKVQANLMTAYALNPKLGDAHLVDGQLQLILGNYEEAKAKFDAALEFGGEKTTIYNGYFILASRTGNYQAAFEAIKKAVEIDPLNNTDLANYVGALVIRDLLDEATRQAERLITFDKRRGEFAFYYIADVQGNFEEKTHRMLNGMKIRPTVTTLFNVGLNLFVAQGFPDLAREIIPDTFQWIIEQESGNIESARVEVDKLLATRPDPSFAFRLLAAKAHGYIVEGNWTLANEAMEESFKAAGERLGTAGGMGTLDALTLFYTRSKTGNTRGATDILNLIAEEIKKRDAAGLVSYDFIGAHALYYLAIDEEERGLSMLEQAVAKGFAWSPDREFLFDNIADTQRLNAIRVIVDNNSKRLLKILMTRLCTEGAEEFWQPTPEQCDRVLEHVADVDLLQHTQDNI